MRHGSAPLAWRGKQQGRRHNDAPYARECSASGWEIYWTQMRKLSSYVTTGDAAKVQRRTHRLVADEIVEAQRSAYGWADGPVSREPAGVADRTSCLGCAW